jgi:CTP-dependent riboflavin kinase
MRSGAEKEHNSFLDGSANLFQVSGVRESETRLNEATVVRCSVDSAHTLIMVPRRSIAFVENQVSILSPEDFKFP